MQEKRKKISCFVSYLWSYVLFLFFFFSLNRSHAFGPNSVKHILSTQLQLLKICWNKVAVLCLWHIPSAYCTLPKLPWAIQHWASTFSNPYAYHWNDRMNLALPTSAKPLKEPSLTMAGTTQKGQNHSSIHTPTNLTSVLKKSIAWAILFLTFPHLVQLLIIAAPINPWWPMCSKTAIWNQTLGWRQAAGPRMITCPKLKLTPTGATKCFYWGNYPKQNRFESMLRRKSLSGMCTFAFSID